MLIGNRPLSLSANIEGWLSYAKRRMDSGFQSFEQRVFRQDHVCQYCGFQALEHMTVVNADGNYTQSH